MLTGLSCRKTFWSLSMVTTSALFGDLVDGAGLRNGDFDAGLQHGRGDHEDEQKHEHDVDQRRDVDVGERGSGCGRWRRRPWLEDPPRGASSVGGGGGGAAWRARRSRWR